MRSSFVRFHSRTPIASCASRPTPRRPGAPTAATARVGRNIGISQPELDDLRDRAGVFDGVTAVWPVSASFLGGDRPERVEVLVTSANYFQLLGAGARLGRVYGPADAVPGFSDAVVISDGLWRRAFGAARDIIGRKV